MEVTTGNSPISAAVTPGSLNQLSMPALRSDSGISADEALARVQNLAEELKTEPGTVGTIFSNIGEARSQLQTEADGVRRVVVSIPATDTTPAIKVFERGSPNLILKGTLTHGLYNASTNTMLLALPKGESELINTLDPKPAETLEHEIEHYKGNYEYVAFTKTYQTINPTGVDGRSFNELSPDEQRDKVLDRILGSYSKSVYVASAIEAFDAKIDDAALEYLPGGEKFRAMVLKKFGTDSETGEPSLAAKEWLNEVDGRYDIKSDEAMVQGILTYLNYKSSNTGVNMNAWKTTRFANPPDVARETFDFNRKALNLYLEISSAQTR